MSSTRNSFDVIDVVIYYGFFFLILNHVQIFFNFFFLSRVSIFPLCVLVIGMHVG